MRVEKGLEYGGPVVALTVISCDQYKNYLARQSEAAQNLLQLRTMGFTAM